LRGKRIQRARAVVRDKAWLGIDFDREGPEVPETDQSCSRLIDCLSAYEDLRNFLRSCNGKLERERWSRQRLQKSRASNPPHRTRSARLPQSDSPIFEHG